jgi:hypothetical protein
MSSLPSRSASLIGVLGGALALMLANSSSGQSPDPHHKCIGPALATCETEVGTNSPTTLDPPSPFGFTSSSGPRTGDLRVEMLVPDNEYSSPTTVSYTITGGVNGVETALLVTGKPPDTWTMGDLGTYLGLNSSSPANGIDVFLPSTQALDPGATGFFVYQADLGSNNALPKIADVTDPFGILQSAPKASYISAFLSSGTCAGSSCSYIALPSKARLVGSGILATIAPIFALVLAGIAIFSWRRRRS